MVTAAGSMAPAGNPLPSTLTTCTPAWPVVGVVAAESVMTADCARAGATGIITYPLNKVIP